MMDILEITSMVERQGLIDFGVALKRLDQNLEKVDFVLRLFRIFEKKEWASAETLKVIFHEERLAVGVSVDLFNGAFFADLVETLAKEGLDGAFNKALEGKPDCLMVFEDVGNCFSNDFAQKRVDIVFI